VLARDFKISEIRHLPEANRGPHALFHRGARHAANAVTDVGYLTSNYNY